MKLSQLPVGALVKDPNTKYNNDVIIWQVLEHGHTGDPSGSTTLQSRDILTLKCFDAKEPNNSNSNRKQYGNNRYKYSNILQWLNSDKNSWYEAQHSVDQEPSSSYVYQENGTAINPYDSEAGFLTNFSDKFKKALMTVSKTTVLSSTDGGGSETVESKVFLTSTTEVGLANENNIAEGSIYSLYNTASNRIKNLFNDAAKGNYSSATSPWHWWLRTPDASSSHSVRIVYMDGTLTYNYAYHSYSCVAPALCISSDTEVSDTPDASNVYTLQFAPSCVKVYIGDENGEAKLIWEQEHEIEALVPVMTSNTTPSGVASAYSEASSGNAAWKAFDGNDITQWDMNPVSSASAGIWLAYEFENPVIVKEFSMIVQKGEYAKAYSFKIQGSNDGSTWNDVDAEYSASAGQDFSNEPVNNTSAYKKYRVYWTSAASTAGSRSYWCTVKTLQFYGYKA